MIKKLIEKIKETKAPICVGLDPVVKFIPEHLLQEAYDEYGYNNEAVGNALFKFNKMIIDECYNLIPAVKIQVAMYETYGVNGLKTYEQTIKYAKSKNLIVIGDVKRGDIGSTSTAYAIGHLGETVLKNDDDKIITKGFESDFITINPYMGSDSVVPFIDVCKTYDKGIFVLVKTSNPSSKEFQDLICKDDEKPLYEHVADKVVSWGDMCIENNEYYNNVGAVVGATYPQEMKTLRKLMKHTYFLVPGYGAQGASGKDLQYSFNDDGLGAIINSSRGIIAAYMNEKYKDFGAKNFAKAARQAVIDMINDIGMR